MTLPATKTVGNPPSHELEETKLFYGSRPRHIVLLVLVLLCGVALLFGNAYARRVRLQQGVVAAAFRAQRTVPKVNVAIAHPAAAQTALRIPGSITPITEALIYARASGYVKKRYVDIGDRVREGQLLAEIDAPELDRQVSQARAALQQSQQQVNERRADVADARAQLELARITWERYRELAARGAIPQQDGDQQFAAFKRATASVSRADAAVESARSNVQANQANLDRLASLQQYERLLAPFTGIITARNFDLGALVSSSGASQGNPATAPGTSGGAGTELFRMAQINVLRILLNVPQENAPSIRIGMPATVLVEEFHGKRFEGKVSRTANTLDMNARTMLTEVQIRNPDQSLLPGMYAQIELLTRNGNEAVLVPGDSIVADSRGILVAVVREFQNTQSPQSDTNNGVAPQSRRNELKRVHLQKVQVGYDYGSEVEITAGLHAGELVVVNPNDDVEEGVIVQPVLARHRDAAGGQSENGRGGAQ